jgi:hypothetical protein
VNIPPQNALGKVMTAELVERFVAAPSTRHR